MKVRIHITRGRQQVFEEFATGAIGLAHGGFAPEVELGSPSHLAERRQIR